MMVSPFVPGIQFNFSQFERLELERDVQNLVGPIINIDTLSPATLYGIRDHALRHAAPPQPKSEQAPAQ